MSTSRLSTRVVVTRAANTAVLVLATVGVLVEARSWWQILIGALGAAAAFMTATFLLAYVLLGRRGGGD